MEPITEPGIDLFANELPSMDEIKRLSAFVHSGEANLLKFGEQVESNMSRTGQQASLATGIGLYILGRNTEAVEKLQKATDCKEKFIYLAFALRRIGEFDEAIENLQKSLDYEADKMNISMEKTSTYRHAGNFEAAEKELKACKNFENVSAEYHYQAGRLQEATSSGRHIILRTSSQTGHGLATPLSEQIEKSVHYHAFLLSELGLGYSPPEPR
jgi:tetratricopeptide (TPR) repeat protein